MGRWGIERERQEGRQSKKKTDRDSQIEQESNRGKRKKDLEKNVIKREIFIIIHIISS